MVSERGKQSGKSTVSERKQRTDRNNRQVYGWIGIEYTDAEDRGNVKCSKSAKKRRERESVCGCGKRSYADRGGNADGIKEGIKESVLLIKRITWKGLFRIQKNRQNITKKKRVVDCQRLLDTN